MGSGDGASRNFLFHCYSQAITEAFISMHYQDPLGKEVLDAEHCQAFVPGMMTGWEALERAINEPPR